MSGWIRCSIAPVCRVRLRTHRACVPDGFEARQSHVLSARIRPIRLLAPGSRSTLESA